MHASEQLSEIVLLLLAAVLVVAIFRAIRLSPVVGYLAAGMLIGPYGFRLREDTHTTSGFAEFGVIFLMFLIGLELSFERLRSMRKHVFGFGGAQMLATGSIIAAVITILGEPAILGLIVGGGLALSSTAIVLQVLDEQHERPSQVGRLALAVLILQDLAVIPLLILVPLLQVQDASLLWPLAQAAVKAIIGFIIILLLGHVLLRPLFRFVAAQDNAELFTATTMLVVLGTAYLTSAAGLSPALGAFMAGLMVAETEFKPQVEADILPFKGVFLGLFFMAVGMSLDLELLVGRFIYIAGLTAALIICKSLIIIAICRLFGFGLSSAIHAGLLLSQGSEFAFVLFTLANSSGAVDAALLQILLVVVTLSMAVTPLLAQLGKRLALALDKQRFLQDAVLNEETLDLTQHVVIAGFGRIGHTVATLLSAEQLHFVAIDMDAALVARERKNGVPVYYGDTMRVHVLSALGIQRARAMIITHNDTRIALHTIAAARELNPSIPIIARAHNIEQVQRLESAGATLAVAEMFETSLQLGGALLKSLGISDKEISRIISIFRAEDYALTRTAESDV